MGETIWPTWEGRGFTRRGAKNRERAKRKCEPDTTIDLFPSWSAKADHPRLSMEGPAVPHGGRIGALRAPDHLHRLSPPFVMAARRGHDGVRRSGKLEPGARSAPILPLSWFAFADHDGDRGAVVQVWHSLFARSLFFAPLRVKPFLLPLRQNVHFLFSAISAIFGAVNDKRRNPSGSTQPPQTPHITRQPVPRTAVRGALPFSGLCS